MITCVAIGSEKEGCFYVQTCCEKQHNGEECDCKSLGENLSEDEANKIAKEKSKELNVPVKFWYK